MVAKKSYLLTGGTLAQNRALTGNPIFLRSARQVETRADIKIEQKEMETKKQTN